MAKLEEHPVSAVTNEGKDHRSITEKVKFVNIGSKTFLLCGTTLLDCADISVLEFRLDDDETVNDDAIVRFKNASETWNIPEEDAVLLKEYLKEYLDR